MIFSLLALVAAQPGSASMPQERQPVRSLFSPDDYPAAAQGRPPRAPIGLTLTIDPVGRVIGCEIKQSSGLAAVDMTTCNVLRRRARFTPAVDAGGNPTVGTVPETIDWVAVFKNTRVVRGN